MGLQVFKVALLPNKNHAREERILNLRHGAMSPILCPIQLPVDHFQ